MITGNRPMNQGMGTGMGMGMNVPGGQIPGAQQQQTQNGYQQFIANLNAVAGAKVPTGQTVPLGFSYEKGTTALSGTWGEMANDLENEKFIRAQAFQQASEIGFHVMRAIQLRNEKHGFYSSFLAGLKCIVHPNNRETHIVDPIGEMVFNEIQSTALIYQRIMGNVILQVVGEITRNTIAGREPSNNGDEVRSYVMDAAMYCAVQTLIDWVYHHPDRAIHMSVISPALKHLMQKAEDNHIFFVGRYESANSENPWKVGRVKELLQGKQVNNVLLDTLMTVSGIHDPSDFLPNTGEVAMFGNQLEFDNNGVPITPEFKAKMMRENEQWMQNQVKAYQVQPSPEEIANQWHDNTVSLNSYDYKAIPSEHFTLAVKNKFNMPDYFKEIPGTPWLIGSLKDTVNIGKHFYQEGRNVKLGIEAFTGNSGDVIPVIQFVPNNDCLKVNLVKVKMTTRNLEDEMDKFLTDPAKILPFMYLEDGEVKTSWTPKVQETSERFDEQGHFTPIDPMAPQDVEPQILVAKSVVTSENDGELIGKLDAAVKTFDPKEKLDAFIIPTKMIGTFTFSSMNEIDLVYKEIFMFVRGVAIDHRTTSDYFYAVSKALARVDNNEFTQLVTEHLSGIVNRWLVECRGYPEKRKGNTGYLHVTDILNDADDLYQMLASKDPETAARFQQLQKNNFFLENFQIFAPKEEVVAHFVKKAAGDQVEEVLAVKQAEANLLWVNDAMLISVNHFAGPVDDGIVTIKQSQEPKLFGIIEQAYKYGKKHFKTKPDILIKFKYPEGSAIRAVTFSDFDDAVVKLRAINRYEGLVRKIPVDLS